MRIVLSFVIAALVGFASFKGVQLCELTNNLNDQKYDFAEINKINYGLFNIDIWKEKIFSIIERKAGDFEFNANDLSGFKTQIEGYLYGLHKDYIESGKLVEMFMANDKQDNKMVGMFMKLFKGNIESQVKNIDFKSKIPGIANQMMKEFEKKIPELKKQITRQVSDMLVKESTSKLNDQRDAIYGKYGVTTLKETNALIESNVIEAEIKSNHLIKIILATLILAVVLCLVATKILTFKWAMVWLTICCVAFLSLGLALPMIELDARLSDVDLKLIGEDLHFDEQVMYYQSKSILQVTKTLLEASALDVKIVGILILLFSMVFPFLKMILTTWYLFVKKARDSKFIKLVIFYLGKWSMADVFVVAIFMSYIGFYGLLNSQLTNMARGSETVSIETVNYSSLASGVIFFTLYCIFSILMSSLIHRRVEAEKILAEA